MVSQAVLAYSVRLDEHAVYILLTTLFSSQLKLIMNRCLHMCATITTLCMSYPDQTQVWHVLLAHGAVVDCQCNYAD